MQLLCPGVFFAADVLCLYLELCRMFFVVGCFLRFGTGAFQSALQVYSAYSLFCVVTFLFAIVLVQLLLACLSLIVLL